MDNNYKLSECISKLKHVIEINNMGQTSSIVEKNLLKLA